MMGAGFRMLCVTAAVALSAVPGQAAAAAVVAPAPPIVARIAVPATNYPQGGYDLAEGLGAVWLVNHGDVYSTLRRIDPATNRITADYQLDSSAGPPAVGDGSIWVAMYYDNLVERLDPHGHVLARIPVGLQPIYVHSAFGAIWVSNHHGRSVSRIDPSTDRVVDTIPAGDQHTFRDGPQAITDDGRYLYLYSSDGAAPFERIDPHGNAVKTSAASTTLCGDLVAIAGSIWATDCPPRLYQLNPGNGTTRQTIAFPPDIQGQPSMTAHRGALWLAFDTQADQNGGTLSGGTLQERDPRTGALRQQISIGGDASIVRSAAGDLWVLDGTNGLITRLHPA